MDALYIRGGRPLSGTVTIHGAKNGVLPLLAATLLVPGVTVLKNCPDLSDVRTALSILTHLGCRVSRTDDTVTVDASAPVRADIPDALMRRMRSSIVFLGAILARCGEAELTYPGGCELGPRPIDLHLSSLRRLGAQIREEHGRILCRAPDGLRGAPVALSFPSVGATEDVLLAACTAEGTTVLHGAAREPEIGDLAAFLAACGARIGTAQDGSLTVEGTRTLHGCTHTVLPDRIETATYLAAAAATGGELTLLSCRPAHLTPVLSLLEDAGCRLTVGEDVLHIAAPPRLRPFGTVRTLPYPGFPTDAAAPLLAAACTADGASIFVETIFENRYKYVDELIRMGAQIRVDGRVAVTVGVPQLQSGRAECTDLRGGAALVVAALAAQGESRICGIAHLDRGYAALPEQLRAVGADVRRAPDRP